MNKIAFASQVPIGPQAKIVRSFFYKDDMYFECVFGIPIVVLGRQTNIVKVRKAIISLEDLTKLSAYPANHILEIKPSILHILPTDIQKAA